MLPFDVSEIHGALALAYKVYEIGWSNVHDAHRIYIEFGQDVQTLKQNLNNLVNVITRAQAGCLPSSGQQSTTSTDLAHILGNFEETLKDCQQLFEDKSIYGNHRGFIYNMQWYLSVEDEVKMLRDRIAFLNIKLSIALKALNIETSEGLRLLIRESTDLILNRIELAESRILRVAEPTEPETPVLRSLDVPVPLEDAFISVVKARYGALESIPTVQGIDETVFYLDRATQWHRRRQASESSDALKAVNILRAHWLLQATKAADEFRSAPYTPAIDDFERQLVRWGMTTRRFVSQLEERILHEHEQLTRMQSESLPVSQLQAVIEEEKHIWPGQGDNIPQPEDDDGRRGERVLRCRLPDASRITKRYLEVWRAPQSANHLTIITGASGRPERIRGIDLNHVHMMPSSEAYNSDRNSLYAFKLKENKASEGDHVALNLGFSKREDLFSFQELMTGYKVVDDFPAVTVTSQQAKRYIGGNRRAGKGRIQLWSSTASRESRLSETDFMSLSDDSGTLRKLSTLSITAQPPILPRLSLSGQSIQLPGLTRASTVTSMSPSIASSRHSTMLRSPMPVTRPISLVSTITTTPFDKTRNQGLLFDTLDPPRLVFFLQTSPDLLSSLMVVDIDDAVRINTDLCECPKSANDPDTECRTVILQGGAIRCREITQSASQSKTVNLASAGRYQSGEGMADMERMRQFMINFPSVQERSCFSIYFKQLVRLYRRCSRSGVPV